jgi:ATP-binding cassette subfamily F protein uup
MLAAMEDLLDSWPGTLIVVSHDRYLLERVTDQQYAILDHGLRHVPGGVEEYLSLRAEQERRGSAGSNKTAGSNGATAGAGGNDSGGAASASEGSESAAKLTGAEARAAKKEVSSIERRMDKLNSQIAKKHEEMADHDQTDFEGLATLTAAIREYQDELDELEMRWLDLSEALD